MLDALIDGMKSGLTLALVSAGAFALWLVLICNLGLLAATLVVSIPWALIAWALDPVNSPSR